MGATELGQGSFQNQRLISSGALKEMHTPQTVMRTDPPYSLFYPEAHFLNYGLGWFLSDYKGRKLVEHGGAIDGMRAQVALIPEEKLGLVVLTNRGGSILPVALMYRIFDAYLGGTAPGRDWSADLLKTVKSLEEQGKAAAKKRRRTIKERSRRTPGAVCGHLQNDLYGDVKVARENGKLNLRFGPPSPRWNTGITTPSGRSSLMLPWRALSSPSRSTRRAK